MKRACKDCEFCDLKAYECHRRSPVYFADAERTDGWPAVMSDDWCGEFQPRDAGPEFARPDPLDSVRVRQLTRLFAELSQVDADAKQDAWMVMRTKQILAEVAKIIDLPAAVDAWKKEQEP